MKKMKELFFTRMYKVELNGAALLPVVLFFIIGVVEYTKNLIALFTN